MKLFILFTLFCGIFAEDTEVKLPSYEPITVYIADCETYGENNGNIICSKCFEGFDESTDGSQCIRITSNIPIPPYVSGDKIVHPEIGYDTKTNTCSKKIRIVNSNGILFEKLEHNEYVDKFAGDKSCLACAQYGTETVTEDTVKYTKCAVCATGYLENNGGCTPLAVNPFGENDMKTNQNCVYGAYDAHGTPKCNVCQDPYIHEDGKCSLPADIKDTVLEGCILKKFTTENIDSTDKYYFTCEKCKEGYTLIDNVCKKSSFTTQYCMISDSKGNCARCIPGYYMKANQCEKCTVKLPTDNYFTGDECNALGTNACDCNPNCIRDTSNYARCISRHCDLFSDTEMSTKNTKNPKCLRCEQGYQLNADNECEECTNDGCKSDDGKSCVAGYFMTKYTETVNGQEVPKQTCRKCEGRCVECISKEICVDGKIDVSHTVAINGLPCFDNNCEKCSEKDPSICYICKSPYELIGGKCYEKSNPHMYINKAAAEFRGCRAYRQPEFVTDETMDESDFTNEYTNFAETAFERSDVNKIGDDYYCKHYDNLPHYYRNYNENELTCAGKNRDPRRNCDCVPGYFATQVDKSTDCVKSTFVNCEIPLSNEICAKCNYSMVLVNDGVQKYPELRCGCPKTNQRINANGICVDCPENCAECKTVLDTDGNFEKVECTKCRGDVESGDISGLADKNYNRDLTKQCECLEGYVSHEKGYDSELGIDIIYSCYQVPSNCKNNGNYDIYEYEVKCKNCDKTGFSLPSCLSCEVGYYPTYSNGENKGAVEQCNKCPLFDGSDPTKEENKNKPTYCTECSGGVCSTCVDNNMNVTDSCRSCNEGFSLIFVDMRINPDDENSETVRTPYCVECPYYCNMDEENSGCYLVTDSLSEEDVNKFETKYNNKESYTQKEFDNKAHIICTHCHDGGSKTEECKCGEEKYQDRNGRCHSCKEKMENDVFKAIDASGNEVTRNYNEVCNFNKESTPDEEPICKANKITYLPECTYCKSNDRDPTYNCTKCTTAKTFAMYDGTNHICEPCLEKCNSCKNKKGCVSCVAPYAVGEQCDSCLVGYYKKDMSGVGSSANCIQCPEGCSACESATKCTACSDDIRLLGPNNDCKACSTGYFYNISSNECVQVDITKGFAESRAVCLDASGNEIPNCKETDTVKIAEIIEIPVRCDTSKGVGISPYPVNRTCVCDTGYLDNRTKEEIAADPIPQCTNVKILTGEDFCLEGEFKDGKAVCTKCNAGYLVDPPKDGKCECKEGYYTTTWGMCVPCDRHIKGCKKCKSKTYCDECDSSAYKFGEEKEINGKKHRECVGK